MDFHVFFTTTASLFGVFTSIFLLFCGLFFTYRNKKHQNTKALAPPQAPGAWPIIGHLHLLNSVEPPHLLLAAMADKYGPIFTVNLGVHLALVVSDGDIVKECLTTNDKVFASRPKSLAGELLGYNYAMFGVSPYGAHWRQFRKMAVLQLLSTRRLEMLGYVRESELRASLNDMYRFWSLRSSSGKTCSLNMKEWFASLALNTIVRLLYGKRYSSDDEEGAKTFKTLREFIDSLGTFVLSDAIPFLKWLDLGGKVKSMKKSAKDMDCILQTWLDEHKTRRQKSKVEIRPEEQDFTDVMISVLEDASPEDLSYFSADTVNKATCLALLLGATDTTTGTLTWALALLLNNPQELKKVTAEFDEKIGRQRTIQESDIKNLEYFQAVVKETMRLYPAAPLAFPHESLADCTVAGYNVPKGTHLLMNIHKLQRDPDVWSSPDEFKPERFLTTHKDVDVKGQDFELIPFGSGRRICPGLSFGLNMVQFTLANLLHSFDFAKPSEDPIEMLDRFGLAGPLDVLFTPRLPHELYA